MNTFKYFAYGSNLLEKRIHIQNKTAKRFAIGKLKSSEEEVVIILKKYQESYSRAPGFIKKFIEEIDYRLDFNFWSQRWKGNAATVAPHKGHCVWGAIWELDNCNIEDLDRQEGVDQGVYKVITVEIETPQGSIVECRSYQLCDLPTFCTPLPPSRYPSKIYIKTIIDGAIESKLPPEYIDKLKSIPHNDFDGPIDLFVPD